MNNFSYWKSVLLKDLPNVLSSDNFFASKFISKSVIPAGGMVRDKNYEGKRNPRVSGNLNGWNSSEIWSSDVVLSEVFECSRKEITKCAEGCTAAAKWKILGSDLQQVLLYRSGNHSQSFLPFADPRTDICPSVLSYLQEELNKNIKAGAIVSNLYEKNHQNQIPLGNLALNPNQNKIKNWIKNNNTRKRSKKKDEGELLEEFIAQNKDLLFLSKKEDISFDESWELVLTSDTLLQELKKKGTEVVGLDSVYKWTKYRIPVWVLMIENSNNAGLPVAFFFASNSREENIRNCLQVVEDEMKKNTNDFVWDPVFSIDKDLAEMNAITSLGKQFTLCNFHVVQDLIKNKFSKKEVSKFKEVQRNKDLDSAKIQFEQYCDTLSATKRDYLRNEWLPVLHLIIDDLSRGREGLFNTNNFTESQIKKLGYSFVLKGQLGLTTLIERISKAIRIHDINNSLEPNSVMTAEKEFNQKFEKAKTLFSEKTYSFESVRSKKKYINGDTKYELDTVKHICSCPSFLYAGRPCKHLLLYQLHRGNCLSWRLHGDVNCYVVEQDTVVEPQPLEKTFHFSGKIHTFEKRGPKKGSSTYYDDSSDSSDMSDQIDLENIVQELQNPVVQKKEAKSKQKEVEPVIKKTKSKGTRPDNKRKASSDPEISFLKSVKKRKFATNVNSGRSESQIFKQICK